LNDTDGRLNKILSQRWAGGTQSLVLKKVLLRNLQGPN
jgi:hypothetical protein